MGYLHIDNLYKNRDILLFKKCYALEKIHGTSAHIQWDGDIRYFSGGEKHSRFLDIFPPEKLKDSFISLGIEKFCLYGELYGGKMQGMSDTYGKELKFVVFDVKIDGLWLSVPQAEQFTKGLGFEFVWYCEIDTNIDVLDSMRDFSSVQAVRNGILEPKKMEGVVLRPLIEITKNNNKRVISKHKRDDFKETKTPRNLSEKDLKILVEAKAIAEEWVTLMRVSHVINKIENCDITKMKYIIDAMVEDIKREAENEIVWSSKVQREIGKMTATITKQYFKNVLKTIYNNPK